MAALDKTPTFNLKAVVQETGIKPDTLRAWERRYGLPQPARTSGGHRLYSQQDIDTLKWLMQRQDEGLSISRAVDLWRQLLEDGKDPFQEMGEAELEPKPALELEVGNTLLEMRQSWVDACLAYNERRADHILTQAFSLYPPETVCVEILQRGLHQIGELWYESEATAQQEHFASALAMRRLEALLASTPQPTRSERILIGCPPDEEHTFSPLLLTLFLRRRGWDTIYLGANVPLERMERTIEKTQPHLVILAAQTLHTAATLSTMARFIQSIGVPLAYGGQVFNFIPDLSRHIPGHFLGEQLRDAVGKIERLLTGPKMAPPAPEPSEEYRLAFESFQRSQPHIDAYVWSHLDRIDVPTGYLTQANRGLSAGVTAALQLGDLQLLGQDLHWIEGLLHNHNFPFSREMLSGYLRLYREAVASIMGSEGSLIIEWLGEVMQKNGI